jgi:AraC-like DNA-binding protein
MLILAVVPHARLHQLRTADPKLYTFVALPSWADVDDTIRHRPVELVVVDPASGGEFRTREVERLRVLFPSLPVVIYTTLTPEAPGLLLELGRIGIRRVILARFDDNPANLRAIFREELERTASRQVIQTIESLLERLPLQVRRALEAMLHAPAEIATVSALAERVHVQRRTYERWFAKRGLPSPRTVLVLARVLYAHRLLQDPGYTVEDIAVKLGYAKTRSLQDQFKEIFGLTAGEVRLSLSVEDAVAIVTKRYFAQQSQAAS